MLAAPARKLVTHFESALSRGHGAKCTPRVASCSVRVELAGTTVLSIVECILAVDSLAIQRSLTLLEDRYHELLEIGPKRLSSDIEK
jgi:hypothetical protein